MEHGDLSNTPAPRMIIIFEGLLGEVPPAYAKLYAKSMRKQRWRQAASLYVIDDLMARKMWYLYHTTDTMFEVVTFTAPEMAPMISLMLDAEQLPVHDVWFSPSPQMLARKTSYMPGLVRVYDGNPDNSFAYGSHGMVIAGADQLGSDMKGPLVR